jgi:hypothetical protein
MFMFIVFGASAFMVSPVSVDPSGVLNPGDPVNVSYTVYAATGTAFPSFDDLQFVTELDNPRWTYSIIVNGKTVKVLAERDPGKIRWSDLGVEIVIESTGLFTRCYQGSSPFR